MVRAHSEGDFVDWMVSIIDKGRKYEIAGKRPDPLDTLARSTNRVFNAELIQNLTARMSGQPRTQHDATTLSEVANQLGEELFTFVFGAGMGAVLELWRAYHAGQKHVGVESVGSRRVLRLLLRLEPHLSTAPWEYMMDSDLGPLGLNPEISLVRVVPVDGRARDPILDSWPLVAAPRVLALVSNPALDARAGAPELHPDAEIAALRALIQEENLDIIEADACTFEEFRARLTRAKHEQRPYHVLHYIGHSGQGRLAFRDPRTPDRPAAVEGPDVARELLEHGTFRLLVFTSCASAELIQYLLKGAPAVVAMQFDMFDEPAAIFTRTFYGSLFSGEPIDEAVNIARRDLRARYQNIAPLLWGTPTVSIRAIDDADRQSELLCTLSGRASYPDRSSRQAVESSSTSPALLPSEARSRVTLPPATNLPSEARIHNPTVGPQIGPRTDKLVVSGLPTTRLLMQDGDHLFYEIRDAHQTAVSALAFAIIQQRHVLISGARDGTLRAWHIEAQSSPGARVAEIHRDWTGPRQAILTICAAPSADGAMVILTGCDDSSLWAWTWDGMGRVSRNVAPAVAVAIARNPRDEALAAVLSDGALMYWPRLDSVGTINGSPTRVPLGGDGSVVAFSGDGVWLAVGSGSKSVSLWRCEPGILKPAPEPLVRHDELVSDIAFVSRDRLLTASRSGVLRVWALGEKNTCVQQMSTSTPDLLSLTRSAGPESARTRLAWLGDTSSMVLISCGSELLLWKAYGHMSDSPLWRWQLGQGISAQPTSVAASPDGQWAAVGFGHGAIALLDTRDYTGNATLHG